MFRPTTTLSARSRIGLFRIAHLAAADQRIEVANSDQYCLPPCGIIDYSNSPPACGHSVTALVSCQGRHHDCPPAANQLIQEDVDRLLALKKQMNATDDDWIFPNSRKTGPMRHEQILGSTIQPVADKLGMPHIIWRVLRHWGTTQLVENRVPLTAVQQRLGHTRLDILLKFHAHVLDASAVLAAQTLSGQLRPKRNAQTVGSKTASTKSGSQTAANTKRWIM
jgi:hypothetical protein